MNTRLSVAFLLFLFIAPTVFAQKSIRIATLNWPPYNAPNLPQQGFNVLITRTVFEKAGYSVSVDFFPWERAISKVVDQDQHLAFFPGYPPDCIHSHTLSSNVIGYSPLGLIMNRKHSFAWKTMDDLKGKIIGTVIGYSNSPEFDQRVANHELNVYPAKDDLTNMIKLQYGRLDAAVIDTNLFKFYLAQHPEFTDLVLSDQLLANLGLFVCFKNTPEGQLALDIFNKNLATIDFQKIQDDYLEKLKTTYTTPPP